MGRLCLEVGRKQEAIDAFNTVQRSRPMKPFTDDDLEVMILMNR